MLQPIQPLTARPTSRSVSPSQLSEIGKRIYSLAKNYLGKKFSELSREKLESDAKGNTGAQSAGVAFSKDKISYVLQFGSYSVAAEIIYGRGCIEVSVAPNGRTT